MNVPVPQKYKVVLLRAAARRGPLSFFRQGYLILMDRLWRKKHLVFRADAADVLAVPVKIPVGMVTREIHSLYDLEAIIKRQTDYIRGAVDLGQPDWFDLGWRMWIIEIDQKLACFGWLRSAEQSSDFFCHITEDSELLWHASVLPEYRGQNLHVLLWLVVMRIRIEQGVFRFYANCRDYNLPSRRNIEKMGLHLIGYSRDCRLTGRRSWHQLNN
jgi:hypothetical protein